MFLTELYYILIWLLGCFFLVRMMQKPDLIYQFPYMMSFGFVVFILPQVFVIHEKHIFNVDLTNRVFLMTLLCWAMSFIGWFAVKPKTFAFRNVFLKHEYDEKKLGIVGIIFVVLGGLFNFSASRMLKTEEFANQQATGIVTVYIFFQQLLFLGTGLCLALWLKNKQRLNLLFAALGILYGFYIGVLQGRRTQTLYTLFVLGIPLYIRYNIKPSRIIVISFMLVAFLVIPSMGQYRDILKTSDNTSQFFRRLFNEMDFSKNIHDFYVNSKSHELVNAGYMIDYTYRNGSYKMGSGYWNELVFRFVPAQVVGSDVKSALKLSVNSGKSQRSTYNPNYILGSTNTGIGDSFNQFDYLGSLFFLFVGLFMRRLWMTIKETESPFLQVFYAILLIEGVVSLTHGTTWFLPGFISALVFLSIAHKFSKI